MAQLSQLHIGFGYNKDVNDEFKKNAFSKALWSIIYLKRAAEKWQDLSFCHFNKLSTLGDLPATEIGNTE